MKKDRMFRRGLALLLCMALMTGCFSGCGENTASIIHLEKFQGSVGVEDEKDKHLDPREGMQLYSGYEVGTAQESKAWISLDQSKSVKMDADTVAQVTQSGKDLKVTLQAGKLFFSVSEPLTEEESFTIETATMVTGIRGTSGWVEVVDQYTARVVILEGTVDVQSKDPATGDLRTVTVTGGQILTVVYHGDAMAQGSEGTAIQGMIGSSFIISGNIVHAEDGLCIETLTEANVPEFVGEEVAQSEKIQQKITESTTLSVPEILEQLQADPAPAEPTPNQPGAGSSAEDIVQELPEDAQVEEPGQESAETDTDQTTEEIPEVTEVYYEKVTQEKTTEITVYPDGEKVSIDGTTGTVTSGPAEGDVPPVAEDLSPKREYKPVLQFFPSENNPQYAVVTHAYEVTTYTQNADGTVSSSTTLELVNDPAMGEQTVDVIDNKITFTNPEGQLETIEVAPPAP